MNPDLAVLFLLLAAAVAMFVISKPRMDAVALIMIAALPLTGRSAPRLQRWQHRPDRGPVRDRRGPT